MRKLFVCLLALVLLATAGLLGSMPASRAFDSQAKLTKTGVNAPPERIFALIEDFHRWSAWSPHEKANPAAQRTYGGASAGKGAIYEWSGEGIGAGRAQIVEANAPTGIVVALDLTEPVKGHLALDFVLEPTGATTKVEVATSGPSDAVRYVMSTFFNNSIMRIACAADGSSKALCDVIMKDVAGRK